jgi:hypothetical protein
MIPMPAVRPALSRGLAGLLWLSLGAWTEATAQAPSAAAAAPQAPSVIGSWARSASQCKRPEIVLGASSAAIQADADGNAAAFSYTGVTYEKDAEGQVTVELGKTHPYGKTASRTALTFRPVAADRIDLVQAKRRVAFQRCSPQ